jgi:hypothetical protein
MPGPETRRGWRAGDLSGAGAAMRSPALTRHLTTPLTCGIVRPFGPLLPLSPLALPYISWLI